MADNEILDILGQTPGLYKLYTQISSIYPVSQTSSHPDIVDTLRNGLDRLAKSFPWLTGQVVNEGAGENNTGIFKISPLDKIQLVVKDLRHDPSAPTMDGLRQAKYPFSMLDENVIAPCTTLNIPGNLPSITTESALVFCVQANFIEGGLILTIVAQHNVMDMTGQDFIIRLMSKACHNEPFTSEELAVGNMNRSHVIPLLDDSYIPGPELEHQIVKPKPSANDAVSEPPKFTWAYIELSATQIDALKSLATDTLSPSVEFISTDDAVSAFLWQSIARARASRLEPTSETMFTRAVDMRQRLNIPLRYPGLLQTLTYNTETVQKLCEEPLGVVAAELRSQLDPRPPHQPAKPKAQPAPTRKWAGLWARSLGPSVAMGLG